MARLGMLALLVLSSVGAWASEGVFLLGNDVLQLSRASSGVASPRSAYWSYMNPASMVDLERRFDVNFYTVFTDVDLKPKGLIANPFERTLESNKEAFITSTGVIVPLSVGTLGGGLFIPSGSGVDYDHSRNLISRLLCGNSDRRLDYQHIRGVLSYAYELDNGWALGVSLHGSLNRFRSDHITLGLRCTSGDMDWDESYGAGFGLGLYKRWEKWAFGASYSSRHWVQALDEYADLMSSPLDTPQVVQVGVAYTIHPKVELTLDYKWLNWESIPQYGSPLMDGGGFNWRDQHGVKFGVEWKALEKWTFAGGFSYTNTPISDNHVLLSGLVPVTVEQHWTAGVTHKLDEHNEVHLVGVYAPRHTLTETGKGKDDIFSTLGKGSELSAGAFSVIFGYSYKW